MNLKTFARLGRRGRRWVWGGALTGLLLAAGTTAIGDVSPEAKRSADQRRESLSLFSGPTTVLQGNQLQCGIINFGSVCTNVFNSPTGGGGFWPTGSQNQYIFNTGLQVAGIMGPEAGPWANDTVGAFFFDASGTVPSGTELTDVYDSLNPDDIENWPSEAFVSDPDLFQPVLVGRKTASQQDSWVQYWDGDPARISGRQHPMGLTVTQRSLAWNYPAGNESLIYFLYNFKNTTALSESSGRGAEFQRLNEAQFFAGNNALPDAGISFSDMYAAFSTDMDVTANAGQNFSTAVLPFDLGISYHGGFSAPEFTYSADLFFPPFFTNAPGLIGVKYLKSPINPATDEEVGLTLFSATLNSAVGFPDPRTDKQLWRYLSGKVDPAKGDFPCNITPEVVSPDPANVQRSLCFLGQTAQDTRFYQASGPFSMQPGDEATIVVAYIAAATVATLPDGSPSGIQANSPNDSANPPGEPSFHPGFVSARGCTDPDNVPASCSEVDNDNPVKPLERGAGWVEYNGPDPDGDLESPVNKLDQNDVEVVPGSLLGRALVAQTIFDSRFLLGFAPEQPTFYLVPGDNQVTVVWEPSATETNGEGDPFYTVASNPASALYNPNYRQFDVEGYRIWRGTSSGSLTLIAQFDYEETEFTDLTCETVAPGDTIAPATISEGAQVGYALGEECPAGFSSTSTINRDLVFNNGTPGGNPGAGVFRLADGSAAYNGDPIVTVDSDDSGAKLPLSDNGVPLVYVDDDVVNNFTYFYAVSAFDVNSPASGPHTLRSARVAQSTVPRADAPNVENASLSISLEDSEGNVLTQGIMPGVDPETGEFLGPIPPTNVDMIELSFAPLVPRLLPQFDLRATIDSVKPDWEQEEACVNGVSFQSTCWRMWISTATDQLEVAGLASNWDSFGNPALSFTNTPVLIQEVPFDQDALDAFGIPSGSGAATAVFTLDETINFNNWEGQQNRRGARSNTTPGGPRWFSGTEESTPDPTAFIRVGHLAEVDSVWIPIHHTDIGNGSTLPNSGTVQYFGYFVAHLGRSADIRVTWGEGGTVTVHDVTHNVDVPFSPNVGSSWGFMNTDADESGAIDWVDFFSLGGSAAIADWDDGPGYSLPESELEMTPTIGPIGLNTNDPQGQTHTGFAMYLNGMRHFFVTDAVPPAGTVWTLRNYHGAITASTNTLTTDPSDYAYHRVYDTSGSVASQTEPMGNGSPLVPGLTLHWQVETATNFDAPADLTKVHTVPDPYLGSSLYDRAPTSKQLMFVNLPPEATIRIYTLTGVLVDVLVHDDGTGGGREVWNMRNRNNQFVASGVYFFHVMTPDGDEHVGKFTIVQQAGSN
jgi:hypothetical protein